MEKPQYYSSLCC